MKDLILALYSLVILYTAGKPVKEAYQALRSPALRPFFKSIPALKPTIDKAFTGDLDYSDLGEDLRAFVLDYSKNTDSKASVKAILMALTRWMRTESQVALNKIERASASAFFPAWMGPHFAKDIGDQESVRNKLKQVVKKMTGKPTLGFSTIEEAAEAKTNDPDTYRQYLSLRKEFTSIWKSALASLVRTSGKKTIPFDVFDKKLKSQGIQHSLPTGFTGNIDANGNFYTKYDELINGVPQAAIFPKVTMSTAYKKGGHDYVFQVWRADGTPGNYFYTKQATKEKNEQKFEAVKDFIPIVDKVRAKWLKDIKNFDMMSRDSVSALVLELLFQFNARIGSNNKPGLRPILVKNYTKLSNGFRLRYLGKDKVLTKHELIGTTPLTKILRQIMEELVAGKKPNDPLFTYTNSRGEFKQVPYGAVLGYFRRQGANVPVHKLRTYHGTKMFNETVEQIYAKHKTVKDSKEALALLKLAATQVGKALNHVRKTSEGGQVTTPTTALNSYIDPVSQIAFFQHYGLPLPLFLERKASGEGSGLESNSLNGVPTSSVPTNTGDRISPFYETIEIEAADEEPPTDSEDEPGLDSAEDPSIEELTPDGEAPEEEMPDEEMPVEEPSEETDTAEVDMAKRAKEQQLAEEEMVKLRDAERNSELGAELAKQANEVGQEMMDGGDMPYSKGDATSPFTNVLRGDK